MNNNNELTQKQKRFCEEYMVDLNATQAAIRVGYSKKTAYSIGHENLQKQEIQRYIKHLTVWRNLRTQVTAVRVLEELAKIAFAKEGVKIKDKLKALDMLAKHVCINDERVDLAKMTRIGSELKNLQRKLAEERKLAEKGVKLDDNGEDQ